MAGRDKRRLVSVALAVALFLSIAVYFRLWMVDYSASSHDTELLRREFDLANREAMDESAEWRLRFDEATDKASKCYKELGKIKESIVKKEDSISFNNELQVLRKENAALLEQVETIKNELEDVKRRCHRNEENDKKKVVKIGADFIACKDLISSPSSILYGKDRFSGSWIILS